MPTREREVKVVILGDSTSGQRALSTLGDTSEQASSKLEDFGSKFGPKMIAAGAAAGAAGVYLTKLADEGKIATAQLRTAIENAGGSYDELAPRIGKVSDRLIKLGFDDETTARSLATLTTATQDPAKALDAMGLAADIARARHISLESASDKLAKAYSGNTKVFKEFGINLSASATEEERAAAVAELTARVHGQAAAQADNFSTKMESLKIRAENVAEAIGAKVGPALTVAGPLLAGVGGILSSGLIPSLISGVAAAWSFAAGMVSAGLSAAAAAIPVLIAWAPVILAVAAIGAAAFLLYKNWEEVWGFIKDVASTAFNWIKDHMDLIAAALFLPFAPLILLVTHWDEAWTFVKNITAAAWSWLVGTISSGIGTVVGFVATLPGRAADAMASLGGRIVDVAAGALSWLWDTVSGGIADVISVVASLPSRARGALGDLGGYLFGAGQDLIWGFVNGISSMARRIADAAVAVARSAVNAVKGFLGIGSPSKLFAGFGENVGEGFVRGLDQSRSSVASAGGHLAAAVAGGAGGAGIGALAAAGGGSGLTLGAGAIIVYALDPKSAAMGVREELLRYDKRVPSLGLT